MYIINVQSWFFGLHIGFMMFYEIYDNSCNTYLHTRYSNNNKHLIWVELFIFYISASIAFRYFFVWDGCYLGHGTKCLCHCDWHVLHFFYPKCWNLLFCNIKNIDLGRGKSTLIFDFRLLIQCRKIIYLECRIVCPREDRNSKFVYLCTIKCSWS